VASSQRLSSERGNSLLSSPPLKITETSLPGVLLIEPKVVGDDRGFFMETYRADRFRDIGVDDVFVQDNHSRSLPGTLRGLHYQLRRPQGKLIRVVVGSVFDVAVDGSDLVYKCTKLYDAASDNAILWNDPAIGIEWPIAEPVLSAKDASAPRLGEAATLPEYR